MLLSLFDTRSPLGLSALGLIFFALATLLVLLIRRAERRFESHLSDTTALRFISALVQVLVYLMGFVLYAHIVPELRSLGSALLTGVSVASVVVGLAAQTTLGNLVAGFSLVLYRPIRIGDCVQVSSPIGVVTAKIKLISLGFTILSDDKGNDIVIPNSVMMGSTVIKLRTTDA
jgi:small-conductance mechanosensitive channel